MSDDPKPLDLMPYRTGRPRTRKTKATPAASTTDDLTDGQVAASLVVESARLADKSLEEVGEIMMRRMANASILGGDAFLPKNLTEAANVAKTWAQISSLERSRLAGRGSVLEDEDPVTQVAKSALAEFRKMRKSG